MKTQRKFKKVLSLFLSFAFILSMATLPVSVQAYDPATVTASTVEGADGANVVVSISITANSGLSTGTMLLKYDTTKLTYVSRTFGPAQGELNGFNANFANDGNFRTIYYAPVHTEGITAGGAMVNITFTCVSGWTGAAVLELTASEMVDAVYAPISFSTVNGSVNIPTPVTPKTINFDSAGGTAVSPITGMPGDPIPGVPASPTRVGYDFAGWNPTMPSVIPDNNVTLTAQWTLADIFLDVTDATGEAGDTVDVTVNISANSGLAAADLFLTFDNTKLTYVSALAGTATAGGISSVFVHPAVGDITTIQQGFAIDGGLSAGGSMMIITFTIEDGWPGSSTPVNLTFEDFFNDDYDELSPSVTNGEVVCTASLNTTITFDTAGGSAISPVSGEPGTAVPAVAAPVRPGYLFDGWEPAIPATFPSNNLTVVAQWTPENPVIFTASDVFGAEGDNVVVSISITPASGLSTGTLLLKYDTTELAYVSRSFGPAQGELNGFNANYANDGDIRTIYYAPVHTEGITEGGAMVNITFTVLAGWTGTSVLELSASEVVDKLYAEIPFITENGSVTVLAQSTITFDTAGGSAIAPITGDIGSDVTTPADPTKPGYTFLGWTPDLPAVFPQGDMTVTADWEQVPVTLTASDETGAVGDSVDVTVSITGNSGLAAADIFLTFDNTKLEFVSAAAGTATAGGISSINEQAPAGNFTAIKQGFVYGDGLTAGGSMMIVTFTIKAGWTGTTPVTLSVEDFFNSSYTEIDPTFDDGSVTCTTPLTSTISFNTDGGSAIAPITGNIGATVPSVVSPSKDGFTFIGWNPALPSAFPAQDLTVVAQWEAIEYTVSFYVGATLYTFAVQADATEVLEPAAPTKTGHTFAGWFYDEEFADPVVWPLTIDGESLDLYAKFDVNVYPIAFDAAGGTGGWIMDMEYGATLTPPVVTREGYTFDRWSPTPPATVEGADSFYAIWTINEYTITFDLNGGTSAAIDPITQQFETTVIAPEDPTRTDFTFEGWLPLVPGTMPAANTTCVAQWEPIVVPMITISFITAGGSAVAPISGVMGSPVTPPAPPAKEGFTFMGWNPALPDYFPQADLEVTAVWLALPTSTITFDTDGGSTIDPITGVVGTDVPDVADPTKTGYSFDGWEPAIPSAFPESDREVTAQWTLNSYTITWAANGGTGGGANSCDHGAMPTPVDAGSRVGYTFNGWSPTLVPATEAATYTAQWQEIVIPMITISFITAGGSAVAPISGVMGSPVTPPAPPAKEGFTFMGWNPALPDYFPQADLEVTAVWLALPTSTITFDTDGGSTIDPITGVVGTPVTAPADPTKEGYNFTGWLSEVPSTFPEEDITVVAQWEEIVIVTSTITFDTAGGNAIAPITGEVGTDVPDVADPTKAGFTFKGWLPVIPATFPEQNLTVVAQWEEIIIVNSTITFDTAGGNAIAPITGEVGTAVTAPTAPTKEGFTFIGWNPVIPATFPEQNLTVVAQWEKILVATSTITFDTAGGSVIAPLTGNVGAAVTPPANPTKEGYTFKGWMPTIPGTFPAEDLIVVAQWIKDEVPDTGSSFTGLALFGTLSLAAAAAFVTRKKKED